MELLNLSTEQAHSEKLLVKIHPQHIAMFRFLLEARENLALFTVLERKTALLKVFFSPESRNDVIKALNEISQSIPLQWQDWPINNLNHIKTD